MRKIIVCTLAIILVISLLSGCAAMKTPVSLHGGNENQSVPTSLQNTVYTSQFIGEDKDRENSMFSLEFC